MAASSSLPILRWRLAQLAAHLVVALIALVVVGGATRVMEAGLACPDWPLCFGSFLPGKQMNIQVFLEWFHRLDAFLIGIVLVGQFFFSLFLRSKLPKWLPWVYFLLVLMVAFQGALGALTVLQLLPSTVVTAHLVLALFLVMAMSGLSQVLFSTSSLSSPLWWRIGGSVSLFSLFTQCLLGGRMASSWAAQRCIAVGDSCVWLELHRNYAVSVTIFMFCFIFSSILVKGWTRSQWPFLACLTILLLFQLGLGIFTLDLGLTQPLLTVLHQLVASLLVALMSALLFRRPKEPSTYLSNLVDSKPLEPCHG